MFRSLATRLVALYVLVAIALVIVVGGAVTAFALSTFIIGAREAQSAVTREAPDLVALYAMRGRPLKSAAADIVRRLSRPGLRVGVIAKLPSGGHRILAFDDPMSDPRTGGVIVLPRDFGGEPHFGPHMQGMPPDHGPPFDHGPPLPMGLSLFFRIHPAHVAVPGGIVVVSVDPRPLHRTISAFWEAMIPIGLLAIVAAWLLGRYITNQALRPLVETTAALRQFASGDFTPRAIVSSEQNEIGELVTAYNGAVQQVTRAFEERRAAERQMRQFVADAGHELRTPLTVIMGFIDVLRRRHTGGDPATAARIFDTMTAESRRMRTLIERLIVLARMQAPDVRQADDVGLGALASRVVAAMSALDPDGRLRLRVDSDAVVRGDATELHEAIASIVENGLRYAPRSLVEITVSSDDRHAYLSVRDHGDGLTTEECAHVFDRFYRGHQRGETEGFGLGLSIAKRAVERAGGDIAVESEPGAGACFTITLPRLPHARLPQPVEELRSVRTA